MFLAREFLQRYANQNGRTKMVFAPDALRAMGCYSWPGNVRELQNRVKRGVIMTSGSRVTAKDLELERMGEWCLGLQRLCDKRASTLNAKWLSKRSNKTPVKLLPQLPIWELAGQLFTN